MSKKLTRILIFVFMSICLVGCKDVNRADNQYSIENYQVEYKDLNLHIDSTCKGDFGSKNLLLVHGLTYSSHEFDLNYKDYSLVRFLADNGYTVWRLDIAGYGRSDKPEDGFIVDSDYAADNIYYAVNKICELTGAEKIDVLGWSWGTVTTSSFTSNHPELVNKLVLYAPIVSGVGQVDVQEDYHENSWENAVGDFQLDKKGDIDYSIVEPEVVEYFCSSCWKYDGKGSPNGPRRDICVDKSVKLIDMSTIKVPTFLIYGDADPYLDYDLINTMYGTLPKGSNRKIIAGAAHCAYIEKPYYRDFQKAIMSFLNAK